MAMIGIAGAGQAVRRRVGHRVLLVAGTTLILTALAPLHTAGLSWLERAAEFAAATLVWEIAMVAARAALAPVTDRARTATPAGLIATVIIASVPATALIALIIAAAGRHPGPLDRLYPESLLLGLLIAFARRGLRRPSPAPSIAAIPPDPAPDFLRRRVPALASRRLIALEAEDHYLRVHTDAGSALILLRMRDAIDELGAAAGWRPHRSFWLSAQAGGRAERRGQSWQIVLDSGLTVPVSKTAAPAMRAAGYPARNG